MNKDRYLIKKYRISLVAASGALVLGLTTLAFAQNEDPVVGVVRNVSGSPVVTPVQGEIIPLVWKAEIGKAVISIPLATVEYYGIQDYSLDGAARVRELTVTTKSRSMVRIYHILALGTVHQTAAELLEELRQKAAGEYAAESDQNDDIPLKTYPITTHEKMVEYRVSEAEDIIALYKSFEDTMVTYLGRDLIASQRERIVRSIAVKQDGE